MNLSRRGLLTGGLGLAATRVLARAAAPAGRVVIVGGGFAGATCARVLRAVAPAIAVTLIEPRQRFLTGPMSNATLAGLMPERALRHGPAALRSEGIAWIAQAAHAIDPAQHRVQLADGRWLQADRLVVAPGIAMRLEAIEGLDARASLQMPHAWLGDAQWQALHRRLARLPAHATVAIAVPQNPYRCPPGPYERASLIAWRMSQRHRRGKVLLLDAKDDFSKRALFTTAWDELYPGLIEWRSRAEGGEVVAVDARRSRLRLAGGDSVIADLACVIPPQRAADIARRADLVDDSGWCPVHAEDFQSRRWPGVHVIGDAAIAHPMPKSATAANSQAKLCALAVAAALTGQSAPQARLVNTCYSLVAPEWGISVGGLYAANGGQLAAVSEGTSPLAGDARLRAREAMQARDWYRAIVQDSFGS